MVNSDAPSPERTPQPENPHTDAVQPTPETSGSEPPTDGPGSGVHAGGTGAAEGTAVDSDEEMVRTADVVDPATVRRAPKFAAFGVAGAVGGLVVGLIIGLIAFWSTPNRGWMVGTLMLELAILTTILALIWALLAERRSRKAQVTAQQTVRD